MSLSILRWPDEVVSVCKAGSFWLGVRCLTLNLNLGSVFHRSLRNIISVLTLVKFQRFKLISEACPDLERNDPFSMIEESVLGLVHWIQLIATRSHMGLQSPVGRMTGWFGFAANVD